MHQIIIMLLTSWLSSCTVLLYAVLTVCVPFPLVCGEGCWVRLYRFLIIVFPSPLAQLKLFYYMIALGFIPGCHIRVDNFEKWHTGTMHDRNVNINYN